MPISTKCISEKTNFYLTQNPSELELMQIAGVSCSNPIDKVSSLNSLPNAECNKGRFVFVEDISAYRYSNGEIWTNCYDSTSIADTKLFGWGYNPYGELSLNNTSNYSSPVQEITSSLIWQKISAGGYHSVGIDCAGKLYSWGRNNSGQLGINSLTNYSSPVQELSSSENWCMVSAGVVQTHAIKTTGELWSWGSNNQGRLGSGDVLDKSSLVREASSSSNWCTVNGAFNTGVALKTDGTIWGWGYNSNGQLGIDSLLCTSSPIQEITSSTNWQTVIMGNGSGGYSSAIKTDGTLWSWGKNNVGQLGIGSVTCYSSPIQETTSSTWIGVYPSGGSGTAFGIKTDGTLWGWGSNLCSKLGNNSSTGSCSPVQEHSSSTNWCFADGSHDNHTIAIKTDGTLWTWGNNICGQLGVNSLTYYSSPVQEVSSSTEWCVGFGGRCHVMALKRIVTKGFDEP